MKYTTIKGTTIAGDVPCETDGWVRKSDLRKIVEDARAKAPGVENPVFDHMIHAGRLDVVKDIDKLLEVE